MYLLKKIRGLLLRVLAAKKSGEAFIRGGAFIKGNYKLLYTGKGIPYVYQIKGFFFSIQSLHSCEKCFKNIPHEV